MKYQYEGKEYKTVAATNTGDEFLCDGCVFDQDHVACSKAPCVQNRFVIFVEVKDGA